MAKSNIIKGCRRQAGYLLLELLAVVFVLLTLLGGVLLSCNAYKSSYYKHQVYLAAHQLSGDLRRMQQNAVLSNNVIPSLRTQNVDGYFISQNTHILKRHYFRENGCAGVYFKARLYSASFGMDGVPSTSGKYVLSHQELPRYQYVVEIQPVTGRVLVSEKR